MTENPNPVPTGCATEAGRPPESVSAGS